MLDGHDSIDGQAGLESRVNEIAGVSVLVEGVELARDALHDRRRHDRLGLGLDAPEQLRVFPRGLPRTGIAFGADRREFPAPPEGLNVAVPGLGGLAVPVALRRREPVLGPLDPVDDGMPGPESGPDQFAREPLDLR